MTYYGTVIFKIPWLALFKSGNYLFYFVTSDKTIYLFHRLSGLPRGNTVNIAATSPLTSHNY